LQPERTDGQRVTARRSQTIVAARRLPRLVYQISRDLPLSLKQHFLGQLTNFGYLQMQQSQKFVLDNDSQ
jgi:hypothetical protein